MFKANTDIAHALGGFKIEGHMFRYSVFVPKLYNYCKSLGFEAGKIMPSRAFCSDENQGYPIILLAKHFGTFPFNHGQVGGIVATDRHGPHAGHGKDMVLIQASHVGYDPETKKFGTYRRLCTEHQDKSTSCGKIAGVLDWYQNEYSFARNNIYLEKNNDEHFIIIDNNLLDDARDEGLFLNKDKVLQKTGDDFVPCKSYSTSKCFRASKDMASIFQWVQDKKVIGNDLLPEFFYFKKDISDDVESRSHLEYNLLPVLPWVVTSSAPLLAAAKANTQIEFDRAFRTIVKEKSYQNKRLIYVAGLHIDISPSENQIFPLTKFIPWAAFVQDENGEQRIMEQDEVVEALKAQSTDNPDQVNMEEAIHIMESLDEVKVV